MAMGEKINLTCDCCERMLTPYSEQNPEPDFERIMLRGGQFSIDVCKECMPKTTVADLMRIFRTRQHL